MALATLSIDLEARLAKLEEGLSKANRLSERFAADQEKRFAQMSKGAEAIGKALGAAFSATVLKQWFTATVDGLDALNDLKDATGASIENISALEDVAARTGTKFESMASTLVKFNKVLADSKPGSETANILKQIGLNAEDLRKADPAEALRQTAVALAGFADDGNKARVIQELFGKSVQEAAPFLKDLAEQGQLVAKVTTEQAQAAEDFNKQLDRLAKNSKDVSRSLIGDLLPALNRLIEKYNSQGYLAAVGFDKEFDQKRKLAALASDVISAQREISTMSEILRADPFNAQAGEFAKRLDDARVRLEAAKAAFREADAANKFLASAAGAGRGSINPTLPAKSIGDLPGADVKPQISELDKYIDQLEKATLASLNLSKEDEARIEIASGKLGVLTQAQKDYVIELAHGIDVMKETQKVFRDTSSIEDAISLQRELASAIDATPLAKMQHTLELERALTEAFQNGTHGFDGSSEAAQRYQEALAALHPELDKLADKTNTFAKEAAANIQDSFGETLKRTFKGDFDSIEQLWADMLLNMAAQAAATQLTQALFGAAFGNTGSIGGILGSIFSGVIGGGGTTYPTIGGGAEGGYVIPTMGAASAGGRTMAAQRTIVIDNSGQVINVGSDVSRAEVTKAIEQANAKTVESLRRSARQGALG